MSSCCWSWLSSMHHEHGAGPNFTAVNSGAGVGPHGSVIPPSSWQAIVNPVSSGRPIVSQLVSHDPLLLRKVLVGDQKEPKTFMLHACMWSLCTVRVFKTDTEFRNTFQAIVCGAALLQIRRILLKTGKLLAIVNFCQCHT